MKRKLKDDPLRTMRQGSPLTVPFSGTESDHRTVFVHETQAAGLVGGKRHRGSGALSGLKSDGSSERYQVECKQTKHQQIALTVEWLTKISREAIGKGRAPLVHIRFLNTEPEVEKDWVVVSAREFGMLFDCARGREPTLGRWDGVD